MNIRQMTKKGDPMLRVILPVALIKQVKAAAKKNKRRPQDELIKRLAATLNNEHEFNQSIQTILPELKTIYRP